MGNNYNIVLMCFVADHPTKFGGDGGYNGSAGQAGQAGGAGSGSGFNLALVHLDFFELGYVNVRIDDFERYNIFGFF